MQLRRPDVVDGALNILDDYGLADLTMRRLAGSLGVGPGALYWHFPNKQALLGAVADAILAPIAIPCENDPWDRRLAGLAHGLRDCLLSRRDGAEVVASSMSARTVSSPIRALLCGAASEAGLEPQHAESTADTLLYYVLGAAMDEQSRIQMDSVGALNDDASPLADSISAATKFDFGLELFVDGVTFKARGESESAPRAHHR